MTRTPTGLSLAPTAPPSTGTVLVYPAALQDWLRAAAAAGDPVRGHARTTVPAPEPPLHHFERVHLVDESGDLDGWYALRGESGIRYEYIATAEEATPPEDATVTNVSDLSGERRDLARAAIRGSFGDPARFYPETALGEWARTQFFGGYYRHDGTVSQGMEQQQTDASFFSRECYYIVDLEPIAGDQANGPTLRLGALDERTRRAIGELLATRDPRDPVEGNDPPPTASGAQTLAAAGHLLGHAAVFDVTVSGPGM